MTFALDILAGMLVGTLMGLIASAHTAILLTYRPPRFIQRRIEDGGSTNLVTTIVFGLVVVYVLAGVIAALLADATLHDDAAMRLIPSPPYLATIAIATTLPAAIATFFLRDRWLHAAASLTLAIALYGILLPNMVIALQNRGV